MNTGASLPGLDEAEERVLHFQRKLHDWASVDAERRFHDLWNLVCDPATLLVAWSRVSQNRGSRTAGIDGDTRAYIVHQHGVERFLSGLRSELKTGEFRPLPVRERMIPKSDGRMRRLGIPTLKDRVVQMALKLVIEPIFESGFYPSSYGYRPGRRAQDAIAEIHLFTSNSYEWIVEADIEACFDRLAHSQILGEMRRRVADKRVLGLVRSFLIAGVMSETGRVERTVMGTPQGGIASPLLANIALSALDRQYQADWQETNRYRGHRAYLRSKGHASYRMIRYADDLVVLVMGSREQAATLLRQLSQRVEGLGLKLKPEKTGITQIDEGFTFLGMRIMRKPKDNKRYVYTFASPEALASVKRKVKALTGRSTMNLELSVLLRRLNPVLRGWAGYFRYAASKRTFAYLGHYAWWRVWRWLRKKHPRLHWRQLKRRYTIASIFQANGVKLYNPAVMRVERYRYRGALISTPWNQDTLDPKGARFRSTRHDDSAFLDSLQQALT
ncbi:MAG TPA: group II intron reverse transcriptase/maturase [Solirubrobacteraceae bacterium]